MAYIVFSHVRVRYWLIVVLFTSTFTSASYYKREANTPQQFALGWCENNVPDGYQGYSTITEKFKELGEHFPDNVKVYSIGTSYSREDLMHVIHLSTDVKNRPVDKPMIKLVANIHGEELLGTSIVVGFACDFLRRIAHPTEYTTEDLEILENADVHILPSVHLDGYLKAFDRPRQSTIEDCKDSLIPTTPSTTGGFLFTQCLADEKTKCIESGHCNKRGNVLSESFPIEVLKQFPDLPDYIFDKSKEKIISESGLQPEVENMVKWITNTKDYPFVFSVAYESGPLIIRKPFNSVPPYISYVPSYKYFNHGVSSLSPDEDAFQILAAKYYSGWNKQRKANNKTFFGEVCPICTCERQLEELKFHNKMCSNNEEHAIINEDLCTSEWTTKTFAPTTTNPKTAATPIENEKEFCHVFHNEFEKHRNRLFNGALWRNIHGTMQDYNYVYSNCFEITVHYGCCKDPPDEEFADDLKEHSAAIFNLLKFSSSYMVFGTVTDKFGPHENAAIFVEGIAHNTTSSTGGAYWRILEAGEHVIGAGHATDKSCVEKKRVKVSRTRRKRVDFKLDCS